MQSEEKLAEAKYFLDLLKVTPQDNAHQKEFMYKLSAFLSAWRSVIDIILYDYVDKFQFCFSQDEEITMRDFEVAARATNNTQAQTFIQWYRQQVSMLGQNPLSTKRKIIVHRGYPPTMRAFTVYVSESIAISSSFTIHSSDNSDTAGPSAIPTDTAVSSVKPSKPSTTTTTSVNVRFSDRQDKNVTDFCQDALDQMKTIVELAIQQFGR